MKRSRFLLLCCYLLAIGLGYWGLVAANGEQQASPVTELAYQTLRLFIIETPYHSPLPWQLEIARWLAPACAAWTLFLALMATLRDHGLLLRRWLVQDHVLICGLGVKGFSLARDCLDRGRKVVIIEADQQCPRVEGIRLRGGQVLFGDATDPVMLQKARVTRSNCLVALCGRDETNVEVMVHARKLAQDKKALVKAFAHIGSLDIRHALTTHDLLTQHEDSFDGTVFNIHEMSARALFESWPLDRDGILPADTRTTHLVVVGFGDVGQSLALRVAQMCHFVNGRKPRLTIIDPRVEELWREFLWRFPYYEDIVEVTRVGAPLADTRATGAIDLAANQSDSIASLAVVQGSDQENFTTALHLLQRLRFLDIRVAVCLSSSRGLAMMTSGGADAKLLERMTPFGQYGINCSSRMVLGETLDGLAQVIHGFYLKDRQASTVRSQENDPSCLPWSRLPEYLRDSNRQQALHLRVKLRSLGITTPLEDIDPEFMRLTADQIELLARQEHARWNAEKMLDGWTLGERDNARKHHPCLVSWEQLTEAYKDFDRLTVARIPEYLREYQRIRKESH